jgi:glycosyltransferase involved in cell wall biosynthesis
MGFEGTFDVSIVMPCLNERQALPAAIMTAQQASRQLKSIDLSCEILISDNGSTDGSIELATQLGCRVVHCPIKGYGNALRYGISNSRGKFIVMGDADGSYDFAESVPMILKLKEGYDLCMGNRFKGKIMPGAMPWKNRYIGNPVLSSILNVFFRSQLHDAHCGLRAFTRKAFDKMRLTSPGMEFASEIVVKAVLLCLKRTEVPVTLHKDQRGRAPHLRPWRDGFRHLRFLLLYSPLWLYFIPSGFLLSVSILIFIFLAMTPAGQVFRMEGIWIGDHWLILGCSMFFIGYSGILLGMISYCYAVKEGIRPDDAAVKKMKRFLSIENTMAIGLLCCLVGLGIVAYIFWVWVGINFGSMNEIRKMMIGSTFIIAGIQTIFVGFLSSLIYATESNDGNHWQTESIE